MLSLYSDEYFMKEAFKQAQLAYEAQEIPVGAVVVAKNRIIAKGYNQVEQLKDATAHAEMIAITAATNALGAKYLQECTLYVTLEPCVMCAGASYWSQVSKIVYGASDPKRGFSNIHAQIIHPKALVVKGIMEKECQELLNLFFSRLREGDLD